MKLSRAEESKRNRELMPETARLVDEFRAEFGPDVRFPWVKEGGEERGAPSLPVRTMNANEWLHYLKTGERPA